MLLYVSGVNNFPAAFRSSIAAKHASISSAVASPVFPYFSRIRFLISPFSVVSYMPMMSYVGSSTRCTDPEYTSSTIFSPPDLKQCVIIFFSAFFRAVFAVTLFQAVCRRGRTKRKPPCGGNLRLLLTYFCFRISDWRYRNSFCKRIGRTSGIRRSRRFSRFRKDFWLPKF